MHELCAPLRLTWDLPPDPALARDLWRRIADGRVLFVEIRLGELSLPALEALAASPASSPAPRVTLLAESSAILAAAESLEARAPFGRDLLLLPPFAPGHLLLGLRRAGANPAPALWATPSGLAAFSEALDAALALGSNALAILNAPAPAEPLTREVRARVSSVWRARRPRGLELRVHDLFLAEELGLDAFERYSGCQAGGALGHLTDGGKLLACRTLPVELGDASERSLVEIWSGPARRELRSRLGERPEPCSPCSLASTCGGGCRGLAPGLGRDPSCTGVRRGMALGGAPP